MKITNVVAVVILYQPDWVLLNDVIKSISTQCNKLIMMDNSEDDNVILFDLNFSQIKNVTYFPLKKNIGIACAQNIGIAKAKEMNADAVIFFDQDSVPNKGMIEKLTYNYNILLDKGFKVGTIGPRASSRATDEFYVAKFAKGRKLYPGITEIQQIISSGSLMKLTTFEKVGLFNEDLFIDIVDFEWCWRAHYIYGFKHFIVESTYLSHMFGVKETRILNFRITVPTSFRIYYQFRNYFILLGKEYVPMYWKVSNAIKLTIKFILFPLICKGGKNYLKRSVKGIKDGITYKVNHG